MNRLCMSQVITMFLLVLTPVAGVYAQDVSILQKMIDKAVEQGVGKVVLPAGRYRITDTALTILNANDLNVEAADTTLIGTDVSVAMLKIQRSSRVTVRGLTLDMDPLPFTQATITKVSNDGQTVHFQIHEGYPRFTGEYVVKRFHVYEKDAERLKPGVPDVYLKSVTALSDTTGVAVSNVDLQHSVTVGDRVVFNIRKRSGIELNQTDTVTLDGVTIYTCAGLGFSSRFTRGVNTIINCKIKPGPTPAGATEPRLMSTSADGLNFAYMRQGPVIVNCEFSHMGDDAINFHGVTFPIFQQVSSTELLVGRPYGFENFDWIVDAGDAIRLLVPESFAITGTCTVKSFTYDGPANEEQLTWARDTWHHAKDKASIYRITLAEPMEIGNAQYLDIPATSARGFEIRGNYFHDHRARGLRIQNGDGIIINNRLERIKAAGITLGPEYAFWREAGWVDKITIQNNTLTDIGYGSNTYGPTSYILGAISVFYRSEKPMTDWPMFNTDIHIKDNTVTNTPLAGIYIRCANNVSITGNKLHNVLPNPLPHAGEQVWQNVTKPIDIDHTTNVTVKDNVID